MVDYRCSAATGALVIVLGDVARVADNVLGYIGHSDAAGVLPVCVIGWLDGLAAKSPSTPPALPSEAVLRKARSASALVWLLVWLPTTMTSDAPTSAGWRAAARGCRARGGRDATRSLRVCGRLAIPSMASSHPRRPQPPSSHQARCCCPRPLNQRRTRSRARCARTRSRARSPARLAAC